MLGLGVAVGIGIVTGVFWFFSSGKVSVVQAQSQKGVESLLGKLGFSLRQIVVDGRIRTPSTDLMVALDLKKGQSIYEIDLMRILKRIERLPWVHGVRLERRLPDTLFVKLVEKHPVAFWQKNKKHYLVDTHGTIIGEYPLKDFPGFIVATGEGAAAKLPWLIQKVGAYEGIYAKSTGAVFISGRRWDLVLNNKLTVKLPEDNIDEALAHIAELDREEKLSAPHIDTIDMRTPGKVYFYLSQKGPVKKQDAKGKAT